MTPKKQPLALLLGGISILFILLIVWEITHTLDPDFGWHLRMGQLILHSGIPRTDPFSYTMPSYPFVDHEWLTNIGIALLYPKLGLAGLSILFTLIAYSALFIQIPIKQKKWVVIPLLLCIGALSPHLGIRPQIISWLFFSFLISFFLHKNVWQKWRFILPLLFILWTNLHGGFALGIGLLGFFCLMQTLEKKKIAFSNWFIFLCSLLGTFINPYGYRIWWEIWMQLSDSSLRWSIQEWMPAFFFFNYFFIFLFALSTIIIWTTKKHFSSFEFKFYILLLFFAVTSARNVPFWLIVALPLTTRAIAYFTKDISSISLAPQRFYKMYSICLFFIITFITYQISAAYYNALSHKDSTDFYPDNAIQYIHTHPSLGNLFAPYDWGGYLIWKLPDKKLFIDGRMPSFRRTDAPSLESKYAFIEYRHIINGQTPFINAIKKYHITTVILPKTNLQKKKKTTDILSNILHLQEPNIPYLIVQMKQLGFKEVYKDNIAVVYMSLTPHRSQ